MGYLFAVFYLLTLSSLVLMFPPVHPEREELAKEYAINVLTRFYKDHRRFPPNFEIPFYPHMRYTSGGSPTSPAGVPDNQAYAVVVLAGKDRKFDTADDVRIVLTATQLEKGNYAELWHRARILEQAFYSLCQRRLSETGSVYYPPDLLSLVREAGLPDWYRFTPFGAEYRYDTSSCHTASCYCEQSVITAP